MMLAPSTAPWASPRLKLSSPLFDVRVHILCCLLSGGVREGEGQLRGPRHQDQGRPQRQGNAGSAGEAVGGGVYLLVVLQSASRAGYGLTDYARKVLSPPPPGVGGIYLSLKRVILLHR